MPSPGLSALASRQKHKSVLDSVPERHSVAHASRAKLWDKALNSTVGVSGGAANSEPPAKPEPMSGENRIDTFDTKAKFTKAKDTVLNALQSRMLVAVVVMLFTMVLLLILNPPMAQQPLSEMDKKTGKKSKRSWKKILLWSSLPAALALLLPFCFGKRDAVVVQSSCGNGSCTN